MTTAVQRFLSEASHEPPPAAEPEVVERAAELVVAREPMPMHKFFSAMPLITAPSQVKLAGKCADGSTHVQRYGKIHKRRAPNRTCNIYKMAPPGQRFCQHCGGYQPLDRFYDHSIRNLCRYHHYERVRRRRDELQRQDPVIRVASIVHWIFKNEWRPLLGRDTLGYSELDVYSLLKHTLNVQPDGSWIPAIVPIDPGKPLHLNNIAAVDKVVGTALVQLWTVSNSRALHITLVQAHNLIPPNANPLTPNEPFADPNYRRVDLDPMQILADELKGPSCMPRMDSRTEQPPPPPTQPPKFNKSNKEAREEERRLHPERFLEEDKKKQEDKVKLCSWSVALHGVACTKVAHSSQ